MDRLLALVRFLWFFGREWNHNCHLLDFFSCSFSFRRSLYLKTYYSFFLEAFFLFYFCSRPSQLFLKRTARQEEKQKKKQEKSLGKKKNVWGVTIHTRAGGLLLNGWSVQQVTTDWELHLSFCDRFPRNSRTARKARQTSRNIPWKLSADYSPSGPFLFFYFPSFFSFVIIVCYYDLNIFFWPDVFFSLDGTLQGTGWYHPSIQTWVSRSLPVHFSRNPDASGANHITCLVVLVLAGRRLVRNQGKPWPGWWERK